MRVNKLQQFQGKTFANHELTDKRVPSDQPQFLLAAPHSCVCGPYPIDAQAYFSRGDHASESTEQFCALGWRARNHTFSFSLL